MKLFTLCTLLLASCQSVLPATLQDGQIVALESVENGKYLVRCEGCIRDSGISNYATVHGDLPTSLTNDGWEIWHVEQSGDNNDKVSLKMHDAQKYMRRCHDCASVNDAAWMDMYTVDGTDKTQTTHQFTVIDLGGDKLALQGDNGLYLARCPGCLTHTDVPANAIAFESDVSKASAQWILHDLSPLTVTSTPRLRIPDGATVSFQADNAHFWSRCSGCGCDVDCGMTHPTDDRDVWVQYKIKYRADGTVTLLSDNGKYVRKCNAARNTNGVTGNTCYDVDPADVDNTPEAHWVITYFSNGQVALSVPDESGPHYIKRCNGCIDGATYSDSAITAQTDPLKDDTARWNFHIFELAVDPNPARILDGTQLSLHTDNGNYLSRCYGCGGCGDNYPQLVFTHDINDDGSWVKFNFHDLGNGKVALESADSGQYLRLIQEVCDNIEGIDGNIAIDVDADHVATTPEAQFDITYFNNGQIALSINNLYVRECKDCVIGTAYSNNAVFDNVDPRSELTARWNVNIISVPNPPSPSAVPSSSVSAPGPQQTSVPPPRPPVVVENKACAPENSKYVILNKDTINPEGFTWAKAQSACKRIKMTLATLNRKTIPAAANAGKSCRDPPQEFWIYADSDNKAKIPPQFANTLKIDKGKSKGSTNVVRQGTLLPAICQ